MWYRFLQLALELEEQKVQIVTRMETVELAKPKKDQWGKLNIWTQTCSQKSEGKSEGLWRLESRHDSYNIIWWLVVWEEGKLSST